MYYFRLGHPRVIWMRPLTDVFIHGFSEFIDCHPLFDLHLLFLLFF